MASVNEEIADRIRIHALDFERFAADLRRRVLELLLALEADLIAQLRALDPTEPAVREFREARLGRLLEQTRASIAEGYAAVNGEVLDDLAEVAEIAAVGAAAAVNEVVGASIMTVALAPERARALVDETMIEGAPSADWWAKQAGDAVFRFRAAVQMGYAQGETVEQIVRRVKGTRARNYRDGIMETTRRNASTLVHSSVQAISNSARLEVFRASSDILDGVQQISTLDSKTSEICRAFSGKTWDLDGKPIGHKLPFNGGPPRHWNSLIAGSAITTTRGPVPIEDVRVGDRVLTHRGRFQPVYATMSKRCETGVVRVIRTETGRELRATDEHPVLTFVGGWKRADQIEVGDQLFQDANDAIGIELLPVMIGTADDYPSPVHERQVFDRILVAPAVMSAPVHLQHHLVVREPEVANLFVDDELMDEASRRSGQQFQHGLFALRNTFTVSVGDHLAHDCLHVGQVAGVVGLHARAVGGVDDAVVLRHPPGPVVFSPFLVGGVAGMQTGGIDARAGFDTVSSTPCLEDGLPDAQIPFDLAERLPVAEMLTLDQFRDYVSVGEIDGSQSLQSHPVGFLLAAGGDPVPSACFEQCIVAEPQFCTEGAGRFALVPVAPLDEGGEGDGVGEIGGTHWVLGRVVSVECVPYTEIVYNIAVSDDETYLANGIVVHNCRSVLVAWMKDIDDLPDGTRRKIPEATQASMDGQVPADMDYESWLRQKGDAFAKSVMGEGKFMLWKAGKITQTDLLDQSGNPLTLEELRAKFDR
jgi:hypothetical protein